MSSNDSQRLQAAKPGNQFGTFEGVFTPSILTILGVIMFMRASFVIGNAGIVYAIAILCLAKAITFTTSLSLSAIGTNMQVRGGGAYFLISRVLGPEFGGAIGIALYFALALSVPFYILGFTEALSRSVPSLVPLFLLVTLATLVAVFVVSYVGAGWALKAQYLIMAILAVSIVFMLGGALLQFDPATFRENLGPGYVEREGGAGDYSFWLIFAIYFPAATGIDAGVNMSGDLKDANKSLPRGTLAAVGVGFLVYLIQILIAGGAFARSDLIETPYDVLKDHALFGLSFLVVAGVCAATLSSALGSLLGAPRVLQAVSRDPVLSFLGPFGKGAGPNDEPRRALILTTVLSVGVLVWAELTGGAEGAALNLVASVITMFFLYTYGMVNLAAFIEALGKNPSFRPRFRFFHWSTALLGAIGCVAAAFLIDWKAALAAVLMLGGLLWYLRTRELTSSYADARRGFVFANVRTNMLRLSLMKEDTKNWRPTVLIFSGNPGNREELVSFGVWLEAGRGIVILANLLVGPLEQNAHHLPKAKEQLQAFCRERSLQALPMVMVTEDLAAGVSAMLQSAGLGPIDPNLVVFGWAEESGRMGGLGQHIRTSNVLGKAVVLLKRDPDLLAQLDRGGRRARRRIDVWWRGRANGTLMLLLAHLLTRNWEWAGSEVRVLRLVPHENGREPAMQALQALIDHSRVDATALTLVDARPFPEVLRTTSGDAACVFLGFGIPDAGAEERWHGGFSKLLEGLPTTLLVNAPEGQEELLV
ncbi:MAG: amino acid permease [Planctomycetota bacterium]